MGYYSTLKTFKGIVTKYKEKELEKLNEKIKKGDFQGFENGKITISKDGYIDIELEEYTNKFYSDEEFANELSKILEEGYIIMEFVGEDGETWGYKITKNKVENIHTIKIPEDQYSKLFLIDTTDLDLSYVKCPACSYEASFFLTAEPVSPETIKAFKEDRLEELTFPPICNNCWMEIAKESKHKVLEVVTFSSNQEKIKKENESILI